MRESIINWNGIYYIPTRGKIAISKCSFDLCFLNGGVFPQFSLKCCHVFPNFTFFSFMLIALNLLSHVFFFIRDSTSPTQLLV